MKILSWNVNGIRAVAKKGFLEWFESENADVVCIQETKAFENQLEPELKNPLGYNTVWHQGTRPGYSGVATFSKEVPVSNKSHFEEITHFHEDGRVVETKFPNFTLLNLYFPNGGTRADGQEMLSYKLKFYDHFIEYMNALRDSGESIIACGDFNICHTEIDIARPKENATSIGFLPIEREKVSELIENGYTDVFRHFNPDMKDSYTWWSYRAGARPRNVGWRIDYFFVTPDLLPKIKKISHLTDIVGSDHCPLCLELEL
jgi:exodeoxyribonuclease III